MTARGTDFLDQLPTSPEVPYATLQLCHPEHIAVFYLKSQKIVGILCNYCGGLLGAFAIAADSREIVSDDDISFSEPETVVH